MLTPTTHQLRQIVFALLCSPDRITRLGLSRWTERGGSYRTIQRFYQRAINWSQVHWALIQVPSVGIIRSTPIGRRRRGGEQSSQANARCRTLLLRSGATGYWQSYPLQIEQLLPHQSPDKPTIPPEKRPPVRPKGRKNYEKPPPQLTTELTCLEGMLRGILARITRLQVKHIVLDGKFGNYPATWTVRETGLHIISKMRRNAALHLPYRGAKPRRGPTPRYGDKMDYTHLPAQACIATRIEGAYCIETYPLHLYHKDYPDRLNVVSTDTNLTAE